MKVKLPDSWSEVKLKDYIEIVDVTQIDMDELDKQVRILSILSGVDEELLLKLSMPDLMKLLHHIGFIYTQPVEPKPINDVTLDRVKYSINYDVIKITGGEYIDLCEYTKEPKDITRNLPNILAIFIKPNDKESFEVINNKKVQTIESRNRLAKEVELLDMQTVFGMSSFFLRNWMALTKATVNYLENQNKKILKELIKDLKSTGVGS